MDKARTYAIVRGLTLALGVLLCFLWFDWKLILVLLAFGTSFNADHLLTYHKGDLSL